MKIQSNYSISRLFIDKQITFYIEDKTSFIMKVKTIYDFFHDDEWNIAYHFLIQPVSFYQKQLNPQIDSSFAALKILVFDLGMYKQFSKTTEYIRNTLNDLFPQMTFNFLDKEILINNLIITEEIWGYVLYVLKLICGEKVSLPPTFNSEAEKAFYKAQQEAEERIRKMREKNQSSDKDGLVKMFLSIIYAFPALTFDYLSHQTMAQIQWLQSYAAGSVSYEVNAKAFAAGNMKKGSKLDFFIK